jgi:hypothetical protein
MNVRIALVALAASLPAAGPLLGQTREDSASIRAAALDYIEGWYEGNGERMARALHPELVKRIMYSDTAGNVWIGSMGASQLVRGTRAGGGTRTPRDRQRREVAILDVFQNTASVRVDASDWVDYLHLVKWRGQWVILNVLWELRR